MSATRANPAEREDKPAWSTVPPRLRSATEKTLGAPVVRGIRAYGGYGPSATYVLSLADGRRAFFKGVYPLPEGSAVVWTLDREARVYSGLGDVIQPWAPEYLGAVRADGWHALLLEHIEGAPVLPWTGSKARRAARSYASFHTSTMDRQLPRWLSRTGHRQFAAYWSRLIADGAALERLAGLAGARSDEARVWLRAHSGALRRAETALRRARPPYSLLHFDTRSDNVRLDGELLRIFDWPMASVGPAEFDVAAFAQSIEAEGGPVAECFTDWYQAALPLRREVLAGSVAGIAGFFADRAPQPDAAGLPRLRSVQRRQLRASLGWAARLLDLPDPAWLAAVPP